MNFITVQSEGSLISAHGDFWWTPGLTIKDRLRVLQPNDPDSYYQSRELVPNDLLFHLERAKIVISNYHVFVACTRARDYLLLTGVEPVSEFLDDLRG